MSNRVKRQLRQKFKPMIPFIILCVTSVSALKLLFSVELEMLISNDIYFALMLAC